MTENKLLKFAMLWKQGKQDELMDFFTQDAVYKPSVELNSKLEFIGKEEISIAVKMMQEHDNSIHSVVKNIVVNGEFGFWEWEYTLSEGVSVLGCDVFKFRGNKIVEKNAFRKT